VAEFCTQAGPGWLRPGFCGFPGHRALWWPDFRPSCGSACFRILFAAVFADVVAGPRGPGSGFPWGVRGGLYSVGIAPGTVPDHCPGGLIAALYCHTVTLPYHTEVTVNPDRIPIATWSRKDWTRDDSLRAFLVEFTRTRHGLHNVAALRAFNLISATEADGRAGAIIADHGTRGRILLATWDTEDVNRLADGIKKIDNPEVQL